LKFLKIYQQPVTGGLPVQQIPGQLASQIEVAVAVPAEETSSLEKGLPTLLELEEDSNQAIPFGIAPIGTVQYERF
jgi:hypothetical protein